MVGTQSIPKISLTPLHHLDLWYKPGWMQRHLHQIHAVWSCAAVVLLQSSMCCVFRKAHLNTSVVMSGYLNYCCLPIFSPFFFRTFSVNTWEDCVGKSAVSKIRRAGHLGPTNIPCSRSLSSRFWCSVWTWWNNKLSWPCLND